jgi:translation initiation factor 1
MEEICPVCHLPKSICTCNIRSKENQQIKIRVERKKFKKYMTTLTGFESQDSGKDLLKYLKRKLACGGTFKDNKIEIQGNHKDKVKALLIAKGYVEALIDA